jgi:hypothetical protein
MESNSPRRDSHYHVQHYWLTLSSLKFPSRTIYRLLHGYPSVPLEEGGPAPWVLAGT